MKNLSTIKLFQLTASIEGWSYLILLFVAMPLKYMWQYPFLIRPVGMAHGILFVAFCILLIWAGIQYKWSLKKMLLLFAISLVPFGTLVWKKYFSI